MREVTLYTIDKKVRAVAGDYIEMHRAFAFTEAFTARRVNQMRFFAPMKSIGFPCEW